MPTVAPCLWFATEAEQAARFYTSVVPRSRVVRVSPYVSETPAGLPVGSPMTVEFELDGSPFTALNGGEHRRYTEALSIQLICADQAESDLVWEGLSEGGQQVACGWLTDRYGVSWQVFPHEVDELLRDPDPARAERASLALLRQVRIDVAEIRAAADAGAV